jgi:hypothetical protein
LNSEHKNQFEIAVIDYAYTCNNTVSEHPLTLRHFVNRLFVCCLCTSLIAY